MGTSRFFINLTSHEMKFLPLFFAVITAKYAMYKMSPIGNTMLKILGCSGTVEIEENLGKSKISWDFKYCGKPGKRGFHVHSIPDFSRGCASTGGHFNPEGVDHASVHSPRHHVGDLPEIEIDAFGNSKGTFEFPNFARLFESAWTNFRWCYTVEKTTLEKEYKLVVRNQDVLGQE